MSWCLVGSEMCIRDSIQIVDLTGKMVFDQQVNDQSITIATTSFENGTYIVQLVNGTDVIRMPFVKH
jgi:hypothetical protein